MGWTGMLIDVRVSVLAWLSAKWQAHAHIWSFLLAVVACGLVFGGVVAGILNGPEKLVIDNAVSNLMSTVLQGQIAPHGALWMERMISDGRLLIILWVLGLSIVGLPLVAIVVFLRAFSVGFSIGFTVLLFGWRGIWFSIIGIFAHQVFSFAALILAGGIAIRFSANILRQSMPLQRLFVNVILYTGAFCLFIGPMALGAAMQAYLAPSLVSGMLVHAAVGGQ